MCTQAMARLIAIVVMSQAEARACSARVMRSLVYVPPD